MLLFQRFHAAMKLSQKPFHRLLAVGLFVFQVLCELDLVFKVQLIIFAAAQVMQAVANVPDKSQRVPQCAILFMGEQPEVFQIPGLFDVELDLPDPLHGMVVSQTTPAFFEIGFEEIPALSRLPIRYRPDFELSSDGSYIHWPSKDVHLSMDAVRCAIDPVYKEQRAAVRKS